jgi:transposase
MDYVLKYPMRPFSLDLRQRIVQALQSGQTRPEVVKRFGVSPATVGRLIRQWRERNDLTPRPITGRPRAIPTADQALLQELITTQKDMTLESLSQALHEKTGKKVSISALQRNLIWLGYSYKKSHGLLPNATQRSEPHSWKPLSK